MSLPELSVSSRGQLQTLTPATVAPQWASPRTQVSSKLLKIECVAVRSITDCERNRSYVVEIYNYASKNRIPTNRMRQASLLSSASEMSCLDSSREKPIARVERQYSDFVELRREAYTYAHQAHKGTPCEFCKGVIGEIVLGDALPEGLLKWIAGEDKVERMLAKVVNSVLVLVKRNGDGRLCSGQSRVPQALHDFLFKDGSVTR